MSHNMSIYRQLNPRLLVQAGLGYRSGSVPGFSLSNLCTSSLRLMKPTRQTCSTAYRNQNPGTRPPTAAARALMRKQRLLELSHAPPQILDSQLRSQSHALPRQPCRPTIYLAWESGGHPMLHAPPEFLASPPCAGEHCTLLPRANTAADVIWHHQMTSSLHISHHASTSTSALVHVIRHVS